MRFFGSAFGSVVEGALRLQAGSMGRFLGMAGTEGGKIGAAAGLGNVRACGVHLKDEVIMGWSVLGIDRGHFLLIVRRFLDGVGVSLFVGTGVFGA